MPRIRTSDCGLHADGDCQCYKHPVAAVQSLEELDYLKSACAAAQQGNVAKLSSMLDKHPHAVNSDGAEGELSSTERPHWQQTDLNAICRWQRLYPATLCCKRRACRSNQAAAVERQDSLYVSVRSRCTKLSQADPAGSDPNKRTRAGGATALHRACYMGHSKVAELL